MHCTRDVPWTYQELFGVGTLAEALEVAKLWPAFIAPAAPRSGNIELTGIVELVPGGFFKPVTEAIIAASVRVMPVVQKRTDDILRSGAKSDKCYCLRLCEKLLSDYPKLGQHPGRGGGGHNRHDGMAGASRYS